MKLMAKVLLIGKNAVTFTDAAGNVRTSFTANIAQENGKIIDTIKVPEELFPMLEGGNGYSVELLSTTGKTGTYLRVTGITPLK